MHYVYLSVHGFFCMCLMIFSSLINLWYALLASSHLKKLSLTYCLITFLLFLVINPVGLDMGVLSCVVVCCRGVLFRAHTQYLNVRHCRVLTLMEMLLNTCNGQQIYLASIIYLLMQ